MRVQSSSTWAPTRKLQHIDHDLGAAIGASTDNAELARAWKDAGERYKDDEPLEHCRRQLRWQQQAGREKSHQADRDAAPPGSFSGWNPSNWKDANGKPCKAPEKRKRKESPEFKYPPGYAREDVDDEESAELFSRPGEPNIKREHSASNSSAEVDALYDEPDPPVSLHGGQGFKRSKTDAGGLFTARPPLSAHSTTPLRECSAAVARAAGAISKHRDSKTEDRVIIYVGNPHTQFAAKRSHLDISPLLNSLIASHPDNGWYVMSPLLSQLHADDFYPVGEYLTRGEYDPNILNDGTDFVRLEGALKRDELGNQAVRCAVIYSTAQVLELPGLQDLAFRKLKALENMETHQAIALLTVVEMIFDKANEDLRQYLVQYMADHYWDLNLAETAKMAEIMRGNKELVEGVFGLLSGRPKVEAKIEGDANVKEEAKVVKKEKEDINIFGEGKAPDNADVPEQEGITSSILGDDLELEAAKGKEAEIKTSEQGTFKDDVAAQKDDTTKDDTALERTTPTEEEMIRMALRESDREATEEGLTKLMQEQSQFFEAYYPGARASMES